MSNLDLALDYLSRGWSVIPGSTPNEDGTCSCNNMECERPGKHPRVTFMEYKIHRPSEQQVRQWWRRWPDANILILTGAISNLVVIDVDPRHGGDDTWAEWVRKHGEQKTVHATTGGGGAHVFYSHPGGNVESTANFINPGVDSRGDDGYIVAPGSLHTSGRTYEWDVSPDEIEMLALPPALIAAIRDRYKGGTAAAKKLDVQGICEGTVRVPEGDRNMVMARVVGALINAYESGEANILATAMMINERSFDPPMEEREVSRVVSSIMRREGRRRNAVSETKVLMSNPDAVIQHEDIESETQLDIAATMWREVGIPVVTDWYALLAGSTVAYVLVTPENEINLGADILDYVTLRRVLVNVGKILLKSAKKPPDWDGRAFLLRQLAREEVVESTRASDQIDEWLEEFLRQDGVTRDPKVDERRDYLESGVICVDGVQWLRPGVLTRFIDHRLGERIETREVRKLLRRAGWEVGSLATGNGSSFKAWRKAT